MMINEWGGERGGGYSNGGRGGGWRIMVYLSVVGRGGG